MRTRLVLLLLVVGALGTAPVASALLDDQPLLVGPRNALNPAADWNGGSEAFAWTLSRPRHPQLYDAWVKDGANPAVKLNVGGQGWIGGIDYPTVVYQRIRRGASNIYLYDLATHGRPGTPSGINTGKWEYSPTVSGDWLLFGRADRRLQRIILHNMTTGEERVLAKARGGRHIVYPGQVNGTWATYTRCVPGCDVIRYHIQTGTKTTVARPEPRRPLDQYAASVTSTGIVYLARSRRTCGGDVRIARFFGTGDPSLGTVLVQLPRGRDVGLVMYARENPDASVDVFHGRGKCSKANSWDAYKITDPAPGP
jgi:hypothetical protein